jgi:hypothetical protein
VKPIHLNLAARPYRDYRPVYAAVVALSLLTAFLMLNNVETYYRYVRETKSARADRRDQAQTRTEQQKEQTAASVAGFDPEARQADALHQRELTERAFLVEPPARRAEAILADGVASYPYLRNCSQGPDQPPHGVRGEIRRQHDHHHQSHEQIRSSAASSDQ